jgi:ribose 1,5-bisphosphokinase
VWNWPPRARALPPTTVMPATAGIYAWAAAGPRCANSNLSRHRPRGRSRPGSTRAGPCKGGGIPPNVGAYSDGRVEHGHDVKDETEKMLMLVVGPSGAGKDTVMDLARAAVGDDPRFRFIRRVITRPAEAGGEAHEAVSEAEFVTREFALKWQAHGLSYGIPADIAEDLARGVVVISNVSRGVIAEAASRFPVRVIEITAPAAVLAQRLAARGRETAADVARRLARDVLLPSGVPVDTVVNDGTPAEAAAQFVAALTRAASPVPQA